MLIIGSGAGGSVTALELAERRQSVLIVEEGDAHPPEAYGASPPDAMARLYRRRGMTPIVGRTPIGYVEGCCVGGSTEVNSGFWHRTPREILLRWKARFGVRDASPRELAPDFEWAEKLLGVTKGDGRWPRSTQLFQRGIDAMGWVGEEVARTAPGCRGTNACASGCPTGAKQGMSRSLIPRARLAGAELMTGCRVTRLLHRDGRVTAVLAERRGEGAERAVRFEADHVFLCAGPTQTPTLLRRSGIRRNVGDSLRIHPMLKVAARFPDPVDAHRSVLPLLQVKEFWPEISLGGAFFTPGFLAMTLSDNWPETCAQMEHYRRMAMYYVAVRGTGRGSVRAAPFSDGSPVIRYRLSRDDLSNLSRGLSRLATLLLAAGAEAVYPAVHGLPVIESEVDAALWLDDVLSPDRLSLTTVHAFSTCPIGEDERTCAADSFGRLRGFENLWINDASMLPDSPGVNPQGSIMALARRNARYAAGVIR